MITIKLRAHHLMCIHGFRGKGYSPSYVKNFWNVLSQIKEKDAILEVVDGTDDICKACPHEREGFCQTEDRIQILDNAYKKSLNVKVKTKITLTELKKRIQKNISLKTFEKNCATCEWKSLGYCKEALLEVGITS